MSIDTKGLSLLLQEASELNNKKNWTKSDERRNAYLLSAISAVKAGASLSDIDQGRLNEQEIAEGLELTRLHHDNLTPERRAEARIWQRFCQTGIIEKRDQVVGNGKPNYLQGNMGSFVPRDFLAGVKASMKWYDPLFDPDVVTYVETEKGLPMQVGFMSDTEAVAAVVATEGSDLSGFEQDIAQASEVDVRAFSYRTPLWRISIEAYQDLDQMATAVELFQRFASDRIARGVGKDLLTGSGVNKPFGLIPSLVALGNEAIGVVAAGSASNDGSSATGANSIGSDDMAALYFSVDQAYRMQPKCFWMMADSTRQALAQVKTKMGQPLVLWQGDVAYIFGKRVLTSPSFPAIGSTAFPVAFGDFSFWVTRHATAGDKVDVVSQTSNLVEFGKVGLRCWSRYDGALLYSSANGTVPIKLMQNHS